MKDKVVSAVFCLLIAVLFGGVGAFASWAIGVTVYDGWRAQDWVRVQAQVDGYDAGDIQYRYAIDGREYHGNRLTVSPLKSDDAIGEELHSRLTEARASRKPITVYFNPDKPEESVVDREWGWRSIVFLVPFALGFGGVGVVALVWMGSLLRPDRPARVPSRVAQNWSGVGFIWVFAFFWNSLAFPIGIFVAEDAIASREWLGLFFLLFPLFGLFLLLGAVMSTVRALRGGPGIPTAPAAAPAPKRPRMVGDGDDAPVVQALAGQPVAGLSAQQREALKSLTPAQRAQVGKLLALGPVIKKIAIGIAIFIFALTLIPAVVALVMNS